MSVVQKNINALEVLLAAGHSPGFCVRFVRADETEREIDYMCIRYTYRQ